MIDVTEGIDSDGNKHMSFSVPTPVTVAVVVDDTSTPAKVSFQRA